MDRICTSCSYWEEDTEYLECPLCGSHMRVLRRADQLPDDKPSREDPCSPDWERAFEPSYIPPRGEFKKHTRFVGAVSHIPENDMQALMEAKPFDDPATSKAEGGVMREQIADAIDGLSPRLRWVFEARTFRGLSVRDVARELNLSKSYVGRLELQAKEALQTALADLISDRAPQQGEERENGMSDDSRYY